MTIMRPLCRTIAFLAVSAIAGLNGSLASAEDAAPAFDSLKGKFLVANPSMADPRFEHAVILVVKHDATGAFGLVINQPVGVAEVTPNEPELKGERDSGPPPDTTPMHFFAFLGGPVEPEKAFIIHSPDYKVDGTVEVTRRVSVTANLQILRDIAAGKGPKQTLYVVGYAGWTAGQLESEMKRESWYEAPVDDKLIFDGEDSEEIWEQAMEMRLRGI